jgi:L-ascorbate metabolism protein UlaG (beta-lactamase superfamily)
MVLLSSVMENPNFLNWLGHDSFRINASKVIYIDPWKLDTIRKADIILVTHEHYDHFSLEDINKIQKPETIIIAHVQCKGLTGNVMIAKPGNTISLGNVRIHVVPAYNTNKFREPGKVFHPKEDMKVGYIIEIEGKRIYHTGDTDLIPEMKDIKDIDFALLPVSGTYVMTADEAAQAAKAIGAKTSIPMHWGDIIGTRKDAERFKKLVGSSALIMEKVN